MEVQSILNEIGRSLDMELTLDEQGQCLIVMDEHLMVSLRSVDDALIFYGMLGSMDQLAKIDDADKKLWAFNLPLTETGIGSIVLEPSSKVLMLVKRVETSHMDGHHAQHILGNFVDALENIILELYTLLEPGEQTPSLPDFPKGVGILDRA